MNFFLETTTGNTPRPTASSHNSQVSKEHEKLNDQERELKKALALKDHYFGAPKVILYLLESAN